MWGDYHLREAALYVKRMAEGGAYLTFFGPQGYARMRTALRSSPAVTRGIGLGIARALARDGWTLALCGLRSRDEVGDVVEELAALAAEVEYWPADIGSADDRAGCWHRSSRTSARCTRW